MTDELEAGIELDREIVAICWPHYQYVDDIRGFPCANAIGWFDDLDIKKASYPNPQDPMAPWVYPTIPGNFSPSTRIEDAFMAAEVVNLFLDCMLTQEETNPILWRIERKDEVFPGVDPVAEASAPAMTICRAILKMKKPDHEREDNATRHRAIPQDEPPAQ